MVTHNLWSVSRDEQCSVEESTRRSPQQVGTEGRLVQGVGQHHDDLGLRIRSSAEAGTIRHEFMDHKILTDRTEMEVASKGKHGDADRDSTDACKSQEKLLSQNHGLCEDGKVGQRSHG